MKKVGQVNSTTQKSLVHHRLLYKTVRGERDLASNAVLDALRCMKEELGAEVDRAAERAQNALDSFQDAQYAVEEAKGEYEDSKRVEIERAMESVLQSLEKEGGGEDAL